MFQLTSLSDGECPAPANSNDDDDGVVVPIELPANDDGVDIPIAAQAKSPGVIAVQAQQQHTKFKLNLT